jgi:hypothetical protein
MALVTRIGAIAIALLIATPASSFGQEALQLAEQKIKAGLLYNFLKYTQWPAPIGETAVVCLLGGDPFEGHLAPMAGRTVNQRTIAIRDLSDGEGTDGCSLLVVHAAQAANWETLRPTLTRSSVLTVGDFEGFAIRGGMIEFTKLDDRIGVTINVDAVADTHLRVHDRLLKLASIIHSPPSGP